MILTSKDTSAVQLLQTIDSPEELRKLDKKQLPLLASEIREFMLDTVSKCGGHLASSLGVVELTIALHYCYHTPVDKILWDVGHQAYAHKIITGRRELFKTLRQYGGISGFPRISESKYDAISSGHASTSISAGLGMAIARDIKGEDFDIVSVIGDASLSGGLAFEGLNNLGSSATNMTVVLNDNEMSISKNVGALSRYLTRIITDKRYNKLKSDMWDLLDNMSNIGKRIRSVVHCVDDALKRLVTPGKFFEDIGIRYIGPIDGHNIQELIDVFTFSKHSSSHPVLIHVLTKKGKGYSFAEDNATKFHGIGTFSKQTGDVTARKPSALSYSCVFGKALVELAEQRQDIVAITAAMPDGTGLQYFRDHFPKRFFDVGIAEGHAVTFAAGLALQGMIPVVAIYSTFLQRAYDQIIHDIALDNLHVVFCLDRAGLVGNDGPTHHGAFDISFIRTVPNTCIMAPHDEEELRNMLYTAIADIQGPVFIRYPRGYGRGDQSSSGFSGISLYKPKIITEGKQGAFIALGDTTDCAQQTCALLSEDKISLTLVNARFAKPLDHAFYSELFEKYRYIITLENNTVVGGFGSAVAALSHELSVKQKVKFLNLGYPDRFVAHGKTDLLYEEIHLSPQHLAQRIKEFLSA